MTFDAWFSADGKLRCRDVPETEEEGLIALYGDGRCSCDGCAGLASLVFNWAIESGDDIQWYGTSFCMDHIGIAVKFAAKMKERSEEEDDSDDDR